MEGGAFGRTVWGVGLDRSHVGGQQGAWEGAGVQGRSSKRLGINKRQGAVTRCSGKMADSMHWLCPAHVVVLGGGFGR